MEAGYAIILILELGGDTSLRMFYNLELNPESNELPPVNMILLNNYLLISMSHEFMESNTM